MDIDLNLNNYSKHDIETLFGVLPGYELEDLEQREQELSSKLTKIQIDPNIRTNITRFLKQAREKLTQFIIPKKVDPFIYANPSEYFQGTINPLEKRIVTKVICIDTLFRPQYEMTKSTDYTYALPEYIKNVVSIKIAAIEIPNMWYMFSAENKNNTFMIDNSTVVIPSGNYVSNDFIVLLNGLTLGTGILPAGVTITISPNTTKTTFSKSSAFSIDFSVDSLPQYQTAGWTMGFRKAKYDSVFVNGTWQITSESSYGSSIDNYFFIEIDDFHNNFLTDAVVSVTRNHGTPTYLGKNIMARIPVSSSMNTIVLNNASDYLFKAREYFGPVRLERLRIRILNKYGDVLNLNANDYSMAIEIKELYS
jgi:hypothetical protein